MTRMTDDWGDGGGKEKILPSSGPGAYINNGAVKHPLLYTLRSGTILELMTPTLTSGAGVKAWNCPC